VVIQLEELPGDLGRFPGLSLTYAAKVFVEKELRLRGVDPLHLTPADRELAYGLLSRWDEHQSTVKHNGHNWEVAFAPLERAERVSVPILEWYLESRGLRKHLRDQCREDWPGDKKFALCLTHDVDSLHENRWRERWRALRMGREAPIRRRLQLAGSLGLHLIRRVGGRAACPPLEAWLNVEAEHGFHSTFHFFADPLVNPHHEDVFYRHRDLVDFEGSRITIAELIRIVVGRGWDVGLHGSCRSYKSLETLTRERDRLSKVAGTAVVSTRQHHLLYDVRVTPRIHSEAGFRSDSTLGSNCTIGFRCGTCLPFFMFDVARDRELPILQIPLAIQDVALARMMAGDEDLMVHRCVEFMDRVAAYGGVLTLLWHNEIQPDTALFRCYRRVLQAAAERGAWGCSMAELDAWWRKRAAERLGAG
jgi:peptidoglycan/xylan/chitin deacetylase (PgdA/CDA1 family)